MYGAHYTVCNLKETANSTKMHPHEVQFLDQALTAITYPNMINFKAVNNYSQVTQKQDQCHSGHS